MDRGGWGARTSYGIKVTLNVYDLSPVNDYIHPIGLGVFHSGVQIGASEVRQENHIAGKSTRTLLYIIPVIAVYICRRFGCI
jgi:hypothetical protein